MRSIRPQGKVKGKESSLRQPTARASRLGEGRRRRDVPDDVLVAVGVQLVAVAAPTGLAQRLHRVLAVHGEHAVAIERGAAGKSRCPHITYNERRPRAVPSPVSASKRPLTGAGAPLGGQALEEAFRYADQKLNVGMLTSLEYNVAKNNVTRARSELLQAKYNYIFNTRILDFYRGIPIDLK